MPVGKYLSCLWQGSSYSIKSHAVSYPNICRLDMSLISINKFSGYLGYPETTPDWMGGGGGLSDNSSHVPQGECAHVDLQSAAIH